MFGDFRENSPYAARYSSVGMVKGNMEVCTLVGVPSQTLNNILDNRKHGSGASYEYRVRIP